MSNRPTNERSEQSRTTVVTTGGKETRKQQQQIIMSNPCIGPNGVRYLFVVRKSDKMWISRRFFILSKIDDYDLMGQYLRDMWYMETLSPDDIREFMIIPIRKGLVVREFVKTLRACSNQTSCFRMPYRGPYKGPL